MNVLVTNDDGIDATGLHTLASTIAKYYDVTVVAPDREQSATSHSLTMHRPLRIKKIKKNYHSIDGTPTDCVNLAVNSIMDDMPELIISGINHGSNLGEDIMYSGTVSAAMEGALLSIPSIAISLTERKGTYFQVAADFALLLMEEVIKRKLPSNTLLNVNVPNLPKELITGVAITKQGKRTYTDIVHEKVDPRGENYYWIGGGSHTWHEKPGSDFEAVSQNMISITPLHLDLTNYNAIDNIRGWELKFT
ncbi:MAG: 5'/3'-nucleotidase SurE [Candidatus Schekmanbacteria bacterium]|nr:5'/3'-nucleotidase SurE [Candidatus Schekmanbacteria bacterium]